MYQYMEQEFVKGMIYGYFSLKLTWRMRVLRDQSLRVYLGVSCSVKRLTCTRIYCATFMVCLHYCISFVILFSVEIFQVRRENLIEMRFCMQFDIQ